MKIWEFLKRFLTIKRMALFLINALLIFLLFMGIRRLFLPPEGLPPPKVKEKKPLVVEKKVVKKEERKVVKKEEKMPLPFLPKAEEEVPVKVYKLSRIDFTDELPTVGTVKSLPELELKFELSGIIKSINVKEGDKVRRGDILATLDPKDVNLEIRYAEAKLDSARAEYQAALKRYEVMKRLYEVGAIIKDRLDQAKAEVDVAKARVEVSERELALSKARLEKLKIVAPQDGVIGRKEKDVGEYVTPNDVILTLIDQDNIFVEVGIIEKYTDKVKTGQKVKVKVDTYPARIFFGYVENIFPEVDERTRTVNVRIRVLDPGKLLKPGMFARANIAVYSKRKALVVPATAVSIQRGAYYASVVENGKVVYKRVSVDYVSTDYVVIKRGLKEGELVIMETPGMKRLASGTGVRILEIKEELF